MADVATTSAIDMSLGTTDTDNVEKNHKSRPEKPDEEKYKAELAKAEKEYAAAQEKLVCFYTISCLDPATCEFTAACA